MADTFHISPALVAEYNAIEPPHRSYELGERVYALACQFEEASNSIPSHALLARNVKKLTRVEAHLQTALRFMQEIAAEEGRRMRIEADDVVLSRSEVSFYLKRRTVVAKIKAEEAAWKARQIGA